MPPGSKNSDFEARLYRAKRNRACDSCRKRKARCDGYEMLDNLCTTCAMYGVECTYFESSKKPTSQSYVRELENRLAQVERLIRELSNPESQSSKSIRESRKTKDEQSTTTGPSMEHGHLPSPFARVPRVDALGPLPETDEHDNYGLVALYSPKKGFLESHKEGVTSKFFGESSVFTFSQVMGKGASLPHVPSRQRPEYWTIPNWLLPTLQGPRMALVFPEPSLMQHLLDIYFDIHNIILPILHRPTFERSFGDKLHERNESFGAVVILMCAIACRHSDDLRIKHPIVTSTSNTGWNLFNQVDRLGRPRLVGHQLYDVQIYALAACFLDGYALPQGPWLMVGIGLRVMQELGVHRRRFTGKKTVENELWKRCFWVLVIMDRTFSNLLGRTCAIQDEDFDVDLPSNCDDEYLEHLDSEQVFKQPADVPSKMDYFISMIRLNQIVGFSQRTLYTTRKSRLVLGYVGNRWESRILSSLENALKKWIDSVPPHLRWDAQKDQTNMTWLRQALSLAGNYHELQIIIHRPFIARPDPTLSEPAWAACNEAAKNCVVAFGSVKDKVNGRIRFHPYVKPMFVAAMFLLLQFHGRGMDRESELPKAIEKVQEMVEEIGSNWTTGKRLRGVLKAALILSDNKYTGWQPGKDDLVDLQSGMLCFVDKYGRLSWREDEDEEEETAAGSYGSTSFENTPSPQSVPSVERSVSESSSHNPSVGSPGITKAAPTRLGIDTVMASEEPRLAPSKADPGPGSVRTMEQPKATVPTTFQPGSAQGTYSGSGGPPPPGGKFFSNPANLRTLMTGSGDGYRSPEPPSRLATISPFYSLHRERASLGGGPPNSGYDPSGAAMERPGPSFTAQQPAATQSPNNPGFGMGLGCGPPLALSNSSVLPVELMVYNDLMMDIGTAQYLGAGSQGPPSFVHPTMSPNDGGGVGSNINAYQWQGASQNVYGLPQTMPPFGYPQPGQPQHGMQATAQQMGASFGGQWPTGSITDYEAWERALYENFMIGQQANQMSQL